MRGTPGTVSPAHVISAAKSTLRVIWCIVTTYFEVLYEASEDSQPGNLFNFPPYASKQSQGSRKLQKTERRTKSRQQKCSDTPANIIESAIALTVYMHVQCQLHSQEKPGKRGKEFVFPCTFS